VARVIGALVDVVFTNSTRKALRAFALVRAMTAVLVACTTIQAHLVFTIDTGKSRRTGACILDVA
jgi:hypothetical protein